MDDKDRIAFQIDVWKKTIDVQQHFNDIALRIRNLFFTLFGAGIAILGALQKTETSSFLPNQVVASILAWSEFACFAFWFLDRIWYHRLLQGAVKHGRNIEKSLHSAAPDICIDLTESITKSSRQTLGPVPMDATFKLDFFYLCFAGAIAITGMLWVPSSGYGWALLGVTVLFVWSIIRSAIRECERNSGNRT